MPQTSSFGSSWQGSLLDLANIVQQIRRMHVFGRLTLRNTERLSIAHMYFRAGKLVYIVGNRGDASSILNELRVWTQAFIRFDRGITTNDAVADNEYDRLLDETLMHLHRYGFVTLPLPPKIIDANATSLPHEAQQLMAPWEWQVLIEGTRRVSLAVAHLVGPQEGLSVLQDILADCSSAFPAFASLQIASGGYLRVVDRSSLDRMSREDLLGGFTALIATCQYFCSPIIGDREAHKLIVDALRDIGPALVTLGVFQMDQRLLPNRSS